MDVTLAAPIRPVPMDQQEVDQARASGDALAQFSEGETGPLTVRVESSATGHKVEATMPAGAIRILADVLANIADRRPVTFVPPDAELSLADGAELLGVSPSYLQSLLDAGTLPFRVVADERLIRYRDLAVYKESERQARYTVLEELVAESQRLGMYE